MKTKIIFIATFLLSIFILSAQNKQQEIVLIGTMHTVPKIVKKSYKPMLRFAKKYNPEAIYVESPMANDSISWNYLKSGWSKNYQNFYIISDSLRKSFVFNREKFAVLSNKNYKDLHKDEIDYLINSYGYKRDNGNYGLMKYLRKYGIKGSKIPTRHEDGDVTYKLALSGNLKVTNMDDQQTNSFYHKAWNKCGKEGTKNGNNSISSKLNKKQYKSAMLPAIFRGLSKHTNKRKTLERLHKMNSFSYVITDTEGCKEGRKYWNERNMRMAKNIATQTLASGKNRNVVLVGASHIIGLEKELKEKYPNFRVILMNAY